MAKRKQFVPVAIASAMSGEFLRASDFLALKASQVEADPPADILERFTAHSAYVKGSIISAAAFLETKINELFGELAESKRGKSWPLKHELVRRLWERGIPRTAAYSILEKYQVALILQGRETMNQGASPFQEASTVISLRNELIHFEPTYQLVEGAPSEYEEHYPPHKLVARTRGKFRPNPLCSPTAPLWPLRLLGAGCARWCVDVSIAFVTEFANRSPQGPASFEFFESTLTHLLSRRNDEALDKHLRGRNVRTD